ncbi:MAG: DHA2 family efflux MFS transporter permease subunit [Aquabacterium sp.]
MAETAPAPLSGMARVLGTTVVSCATFMIVLDSAIANVSVPAIAGDLGASPSQGTWVITSFGMANAVAVPLTGWLAQRIGVVRLFVGSLLLFTLASVLCGLAGSLTQLVVARVFQGLVAGPMMPLAQTLLMSSYPPARLSSALAIWSMTTLVAPIIGPVLGGWITDHIGWPWIFFINIPVGLVAALLAWTIYAPRETAIRRVPIDAIGLALLVLGVGAFQVMLDLGKDAAWFESRLIVVLAVVSLVALLFFLAWELTEAHPVVDLTLLARRNFVVGTAVQSMAYGLYVGSVLLMPLWLQQYMGYSATDAGLTMAPVGLLAILLLPWVARLMTRVDLRWLTTGAFFVFALVFQMRADFTPQADLATLMWPTFVQGIAVAFFFTPLTALSVSGLPPQRIPQAAGLSNFVRISAGAFGVSLITTLWEHRAIVHHARLTERLGDRESPALAEAWARLASAGLDDLQVPAQIERMIALQSHTRAADDVFLAASWIFLAMIPLVWWARPPQVAQPAQTTPARR